MPSTTWYAITSLLETLNFSLSTNEEKLALNVLQELGVKMDFVQRLVNLEIICLSLSVKQFSSQNFT